MIYTIGGCQKLSSTTICTLYKKGKLRPNEAASSFGEAKLFTLLDLCVSSLRRGHANLLCIVPILTDDPRREVLILPLPQISTVWRCQNSPCHSTDGMQRLAS